MWMLTKRSPQHRRILIMKWIGRPILCKLCVFPRHCCHCPMGIWITVIKAEVKIIRGLNNTEFLSSRWTWPQPPLSAQSASSRYNTEFPIWHTDDQPAIWWQIDYTGLLPSWKGRSFIRIATDTLDINFLYCCQNYYPYIYRMPYSSSWYSTQHCLWSKGSLHTKLSQCSFPGITMFSNSLQNGPLNIRPPPQPWTRTICDQTLCLSAWLSSACFQTLCHQGLPQAGTPSVTPCGLSWIPTPRLSGLPPPVAVILSK